MITDQQLLTRVNGYLAALEVSYRNTSAMGINWGETRDFNLEQGTANTKYHRITGANSVHAFVDADGFLYKSEGWKKPAKGARYDLLNDDSYLALLREAHWAGGHLYVGGGTHVNYQTVADRPVKATAPVSVTSATVRRHAPKVRG